MSARVLALVLLTPLTFPATAAAEWIVSPYVGVRFAANTTFVVGRAGAEERKFVFGSSIGLLTSGVLGLEADVAFVPGFFQGAFVNRSGALTTLMGNVIVAAPLAMTQYGLRPYLVGGAGLLHAGGSAELTGPVIDSNLFGINIGGGAFGPVSPHTSLRFDVRYFSNVGSDHDATVATQGNLRLSFWRGSVGLTFRF